MTLLGMQVNRRLQYDIDGNAGYSKATILHCLECRLFEGYNMTLLGMQVIRRLQYDIAGNAGYSKATI